MLATESVEPVRSFVQAVDNNSNRLLEFIKHSEITDSPHSIGSDVVDHDTKY